MMIDSAYESQTIFSNTGVLNPTLVQLSTTSDRFKILSSMARQALHLHTSYIEVHLDISDSNLHIPQYLDILSTIHSMSQGTGLRSRA